MSKVNIQTVNIFFHGPNGRAAVWDKKIKTWLKAKYHSVKTSGKPDAVIVLGGDGTILEAARKYKKENPIIVGLNLGRVGFLASIRDEKNFLRSLGDLIEGKFAVVERMMITAEVRRRGKIVFESDALNEVVIKNLMGIVELQTRVEDHPVQYIRGSGVLVSTATGSTAYNLSAHGPIVMPDIKCLILTELLDHSIPTPSVVVKYSNRITIKILSFRPRELLSMGNKKVDVILNADGESIFPLEAGDAITIKSSPNLIRFAELEKHYFFKSLEEKFGFK